MSKHLLPILLLLTSLLAACGTPSADTPKDLSALQEAAWFINQENLRLLQRMQREVETAGNRPADVAEKQQAEALVRQRQAYLQGGAGADGYLAALTSAYDSLHLAQTGDSRRLLQWQQAGQEQGDSLAYRQFLLQVLLLENEVLNSYARRLAPGNVLHPPSWQLIKPTDTLAAGEVYEFTIVPGAYDFSSTQILADSSLSISLAGQPRAVKNRLWLKGGVLLGEVYPQEAGVYTLRGEFTLYNPFFGMRRRSHFTDSFVVH